MLTCSFDITVKGNGQETNADHTLLMYVDCEGDFTVPITLSKGVKRKRTNTLCG